MSPLLTPTRRLVTACAVILLSLSGCGTYVPQLHEAWEEADLDDNLVLRIKNSIYCELRQAVHSIKTKTYVDPNQIDDDLLPKNYGAQLTLTFQVDETGAANPGVSATRSLGGTDLFTFAAGATLSSQATRIDKYYSFFTLGSLKAPITDFDSSCGYPRLEGPPEPLDRHGSSPLLLGDLGIKTWLFNAVRQNGLIPSDKLPKSDKEDVLSYEVKFIVITSGTVNPTVKLVNLSSGNGQPFLSANRTRQHDLLLTLGPDVKIETRGRNRRRLSAPGDAAFSLHFSSEIGTAVRGALQNLTVPLQ